MANRYFPVFEKFLSSNPDVSYRDNIRNFEKKAYTTELKTANTASYVPIEEL